MKPLEDSAPFGKRVLVRINADVPLHGQGLTPEGDFRLRAVLPTLHYLLDREAKVILISHLGRPQGHRTAELSLKPIYNYLARLLKKPIQFAPQLFSSSTAEAVKNLKNGEVLALENLRFDPGEDKNSRTFAAKLARYGELYVNDAFSVSHREASSVVAITELLPSYAGLLFEREVQVLINLIRHPARPYVAIIGGAKIADKLPVLRSLSTRADRILVGGGVANTFLAATGTEVKKSLVDPEYLKAAKEIYRRARSKIILPTDFVWHEDKIMDIGPATTKTFSAHLKSAKTIFWNGNLGRTEEPRFAQASETVARLMAESMATTIVGGGNTIEVLEQLKLSPKMSFVSTGGGAALELIAGRVLPGVKALN